MQVISLDQQLNFFNGKAIPKKKINVEKNIGYKVYGSNGVIGYSESFNHENAIVIGRVGAYCGSVQYEPGKFWATDNTIVCRPTDLKEITYFYYLLEFLNLNQYAGGAAQPLLTQSVLNTIKVKIHDESEREFLGNFLNKIDESMDLIEKQIFIFEKLIRSNFEEWFINFKFPNHEHVKFVDGIPEGWEYNELIELFVLQRGFDLSNSKRILGDIPIYASTGIVGYHNENKVLEKTVITGRSGSLGEVMITNGPSWPLNTTLWVKEFKKFTPEMAYFTLKNLELESFNAGAAVPTLNRNDVHKVKILTPTKEIINEFSKLASQIFDQIHLLKLKNEKLVELKETLLPRLMSGELDVSKLSSIE